jgi:hypothetical protein
MGIIIISRPSSFSVLVARRQYLSALKGRIPFHAFHAFHSTAILWVLVSPQSLIVKVRQVEEPGPAPSH